MQRASHAAIGLPSRSSIASLMLGFLMPADVRRSFTLPPGVGTADENVLRPTDPYGGQTGRRIETHRVGSSSCLTPSGVIRELNTGARERGSCPGLLRLGDSG